MRKKIVSLFVALSLSGCAVFDRSELPFKNHTDVSAIKQPGKIVGTEDDFNVNLDLLVDDDLFISLPLQKAGVLPDVKIQPFSVSNATIYDFVRSVLDGTGISFSIDFDNQGSNVIRRSVSASNISGSLDSVIKTFSDSIGFYYYYADGVLHIVPDRQFIAKIPPVDNLFASLPAMLKTLGAADVFIDKTSRTVTYRANKPAQEKVAHYMQWVRDNKKLIVYETYVAEVVLDDSVNTGIQWNNFSWAGAAGKTPVTMGISGTSAAVGAATTGSLAASTAFTGGHFALNVLTNFLKTQGTVRQISKIPMMLISGGNSTFHDGGTNFYVSSIGAPTIAANGQVIQGMSQLSPLSTGMDVKLTGDIYDGTIFTTVNLIMNTLTGYQTFPAGAGQNMQAPITTNRSVDASVRVRAGDAILIAGINYDNYTANISGLPGMNGGVSLASDNSKSAHRSELVVVLRPTIIDFTRKRPDSPVSDPVLPSAPVKILAPVSKTTAGVASGVPSDAPAKAPASALPSDTEATGALAVSATPSAAAGGAKGNGPSKSAAASAATNAATGGGAK